MDAKCEQELKNLTPEFQSIDEYEDADDEMLFIANHIKKTTQHNENVQPNRIKFLYSDKPKKEGEHFSMFELFKRSNIDKKINDSYDFILTIFYYVWKELTPQQRVIMLDKALCAIDMGSMEKQKISKRPPDSKEFKANMRFFGPDLVMKTSEIVDEACFSIMEERAEEKRRATMGKKGKKKHETVEEI